jgi:hypothetical protein
VHERSVELQRSEGSEEGPLIGLKSGARAALLLKRAHDRLAVYRQALEERFGEQPPDALVFQATGPEGPLWIREGDEKIRSPGRKRPTNWTGRVWRPARERAALAPNVDPRMAGMRFYDCRHTAISMALHSEIVVNDHGYYAHVIARYLGVPAIDLEEERAAARRPVEAEPSGHLDDWSPRLRARALPNRRMALPMRQRDET